MENSKPSDSFSEKRGHEYGVHHIQVSESAKLVDYIRQASGLTPERIQELITLGAVYLNLNRFFGSYDQSVGAGDYLRVHSTPRRYRLALDIKSLIVFENSDFVVLNKPPGLPVHALVDNFRENILFILQEKLGCELFVTSRLDIPTSGFIVYAKNQAFQKKYNIYVRDGEIQKVYRAIAENKKQVELTTPLIHFMEPSMKAPKKIRREGLEGDLRCELEVLKQTSAGDDCTEFSIRLITGRTHQIRAQLSFEGLPILGDAHYGSHYRATSLYEEIALQSCGLKFPGGFDFSLESFNWREKFKLAY